MGHAITRKYLSSENETSQQFIGWLNKMFS